MDPNVDLPYICKDGDKYIINRKHRYYTQCLVRMAVTGYESIYFMVCTPHGYILDHIKFDENEWLLLKLKLVRYYKDVYLKCIYSDV